MNEYPIIIQKEKYKKLADDGGLFVFIIVAAAMLLQ